MIKLYELFADKNFHTSVATTFGIDFDAYETIVLPRLRGSGCRNNVVFADGRMLTHALAGASTLPKQAGKFYNVEGVLAQGVFHPKIFLQLGRHGGRLIVGSANMTSPGLAGNLELVDVLSCGEEDSGEQRIIAQAWDYVVQLFDTGKQGLAIQRDWALARTPWLKRAIASTSVQALSDTTSAALLPSGEARGIGRRFAELVTGPVLQLFVVSPYWDRKLDALSHLRDKLAPKNIVILLDKDAMTFPKDALRRHSNVLLYGRKDFRKGRFIHAKILIAHTADADHVLLGSANCTVAALGTESYSGLNDEVSLYRRLPPGRALDALELSSAFIQDSIIDPATLPEPERDNDLPMDELLGQTPGQFECRVDVLIWRAPKLTMADPKTIQLLKEDGEPIACSLTMLSLTDERYRFQITGTNERPSFATVVYSDGRRSAPAIVTLVDLLSTVIRETRSSKTENALRDLDIETEASLKLLEIIEFVEQLEASEELETIDKEGRSRPGKAHSPNEEIKYGKLDYEKFIAGRRPRSVGSPSHNSLSGSELSNVRGLLNRIVGVVDGIEGDENPTNEDAEDPNGAGGDTESEDDFPSIKQPAHAADLEEQKMLLLQRNAARAKATKEQIVAAVMAFGKRVKTRQLQGSLDNRDILRLRALLMVVCTAGWSGTDKHSIGDQRRSSVQVLPSEGDANSWPFVMGRLLFTMFGGKDPAIRQLYLKNDHDQIPADITECWATAYWCLQACLAANVSAPESKRIAQFTLPVANVAYSLCLPTKAELLGEDVASIISGMSGRYSKSVGVDPTEISKGHSALIKKLFG
ncbi:hypothetical protein IHQ71_28285 [Rhizobium sp. TH2]|uniref:hypothetical protein n=1 Tax=Rhizobium sp. TH2 TaxID=2775403 RepID=UPI002157C769|nr:hypothetical protein [Rhizobium sp. TH2]UVC08967.1 hypothetical protein IHQ71_28285 [Rhizobium sp. TH2]